MSGFPGSPSHWAEDLDKALKTEIADLNRDLTTLFAALPGADPGSFRRQRRSRWPRGESQDPSVSNDSGMSKASAASRFNTSGLNFSGV